MLLEIKTKDSTEYIEVDRVEDTEDKVYYDNYKIDSDIVKEDCEFIALHRNDRWCKILHIKDNKWVNANNYLFYLF